MHSQLSLACCSKYKVTNYHMYYNDKRKLISLLKVIMLSYTKPSKTYTVKPDLFDIPVIRCPVLSDIDDDHFSLCFTLRSATPCLFRQKTSLPVHFGLDRFHCLLFYIQLETISLNWRSK